MKMKIKKFHDYCPMCGDFVLFTYQEDTQASDMDGNPITGTDHIFWSKCCNWAVSVHEDRIDEVVEMEKNTNAADTAEKERIW